MALSASAMTMSAEDPASCDFCAIARGDDDSTEIICEGPTWVAFFPISPATPGHTLIIPRMHVRDLWAADSELAAELMKGVVRVGRAVNDAMRPEGMNLITSAGEPAEQSVFHLHLHVVPRWRRDGFGHIWPREERYEDSDLDVLASRIRQACAGSDSSTPSST